MLNLILVGLLAHFASHSAPRCPPELLGSKLRRAPAPVAPEIARQTENLAEFRRAIAVSLKGHILKLADQGFVRVIEAPSNDPPLDFAAGWGPRREGQHEAWLQVPGRLVRKTDLGPKPTPFADAILKLCADQGLTGELFHWVLKETYQGTAYGQWHRVTEAVTTPVAPPEPTGRPKPDWAASIRRPDQGERLVTLTKGQPPTFVRIGWR